MSHDTYADDFSQAGGRLLGAARRNPEALLLLAAGCCLLMRSGGSLFKGTSGTRYDDTGHEHRADFSRAFPKPASSSVREGLSRAADTAGEYASDIKDRVSDAASSYTEAAADLAQDASRKVSEHASRLTRQAQSTLESGMNRVLREQPLALVMAGLAAGAAVAAVFPSTEIEDRTLGGAGEGLRQAAGKAAEKVKDAAGKAGERFKSAAEERGLTSKGLKELAGEVADTFTDAVSGEPDDPGRATTTAPQSGAAAPGAGQSFGARQAGRAANQSSDPARPDMGPRQGNR
jgi:hypothetical protein